ncbi:hypothetical protein SASC598O11_007620 [Snodgrassella alvi SCGC AB-598-O11]|nr:hypothetical protein SASC598O11_007620 [Snodgrassella alvi SCGC AB-598-O11]
MTKVKSAHYFLFEIDRSKLDLIDRQNDFLRLYTKGDVKLRDENNKLRIDVKRGQIFCDKK